MCNLGKYFNCFFCTAQNVIVICHAHLPALAHTHTYTHTPSFWAPFGAGNMIKFYRLEIFQFSQGASASLDTTHARIYAEMMMMMMMGGGGAAVLHSTPDMYIREGVGP